MILNYEVIELENEAFKKITSLHEDLCFLKDQMKILGSKEHVTKDIELLLLKMTETMSILKPNK